MDRVAKFEGKDKYGRSEDSLVTGVENDYLVIGVYRNSKQVSRFNIAGEEGKRLIRSLIDGLWASDREAVKDLFGENSEIDPVGRAELVESVLGTFSGDELVKLLNTDRFENVERLESKVDSGEEHGYSGRSDVEKTREQVLDLIYNEFGEDWFYTKDFKKVYNRNFDKGQPRNWVTTLSQGGWLRRNSVGDDAPWNAKYRYKLSSRSLDTVQNFGGFTSEDNPGWQKKKEMLTD